MTETARFRYIGITDECVDCQREGCPKTGLRSTVVIQPLNVDGADDGEPTYYGSTCAARALGVTGRDAGARVLAAARGADYRTRAAAEDARRVLAHHGLPETGEPTDDEIRHAVRSYVRSNRNVADLVARTGIGVRARVLDLLARHRAALADARHLTGA